MSKFFSLEEVEFSTVMRGYDRTQVDDYSKHIAQAMRDAQTRRQDTERQLSEIAGTLRRAEQRVSGLERKLNENAAQIAENEQPTLGGMGARVERLLRAADVEADHEADETKRQAKEIVEAARLEAAKIVDTARVVASTLSGTASRDTEELIKATKAESVELIATARKEADQKRSTAHRETAQQKAQAASAVDKLRTEATRQITSEKASADRETAQLRTAAARESEQRRAEAATLLAETAETRQRRSDALSLELAERWELFEREQSKRHSDAVAAAQQSVTESEAHAELAERQYREACQRADDRKVEADAVAKQARQDSEIAVAEVIAEAKAAAARIRSEADHRAENLVTPLRKEVEDLERRHATVNAHLADLRRQLSQVTDVDDVDKDAPTVRFVEPPTQRIPV